MTLALLLLLGILDRQLVVISTQLGMKFRQFIHVSRAESFKNKINERPGQSSLLDSVPRQYFSIGFFFVRALLLLLVLIFLALVAFAVLPCNQHRYRLPRATRCARNAI